MSSRPTSASTFGSICVPKMKDYSMNPKVSVYRTDGSGRDTYINFDNEGFRNNIANNYRKMYNIRKESDKLTNLYPKFSIYKADGYGRDSYIVSTSGGFFKATDTKIFSLTLRTHKGYSIYKNNDYINYANHYRSQSMIIQNNQLSKKQRELSARLSKPKE